MSMMDIINNPMGMVLVTQLVNIFVTSIVLQTKMKTVERDLVRLENAILRSHQRIDKMRTA